jgi:hypothetical protein
MVDVLRDLHVLTLLDVVAQGSLNLFQVHGREFQRRRHQRVHVAMVRQQEVAVVGGTNGSLMNSKISDFMPATPANCSMTTWSSALYRTVVELT